MRIFHPGLSPDMWRFSSLVRAISTIVIGFAILVALYGLWVRYQIEPVTRDGKVRADVVPIAPDVSGVHRETPAFGRYAQGRPLCNDQ